VKTAYIGSPFAGDSMFPFGIVPVEGRSTPAVGDEHRRPSMLNT